MHTHLLFFPAVSSHFHIVLLWENPAMTTAQAYSSETRAWSSEADWSLQAREARAPGTMAIQQRP